MNTQETIDAIYKLVEVAARKRIPWRRKKPDSIAIWLGAKWQRAGFYHVQIYRWEAPAYLRRQNDEFWSGPYPRLHQWMRFVPRPDMKP